MYCVVSLLVMEHFHCWQLVMLIHTRFELGNSSQVDQREERKLCLSIRKPNRKKVVKMCCRDINLLELFLLITLQKLLRKHSSRLGNVHSDRSSRYQSTDFQTCVYTAHTESVRTFRISAWFWSLKIVMQLCWWQAKLWESGKRLWLTFTLKGWGGKLRESWQTALSLFLIGLNFSSRGGAAESLRPKV